MATIMITDVPTKVAKNILKMLGLVPEAIGISGLADVAEPAPDGGASAGGVGGRGTLVPRVRLPIPAVTARITPANSPAL